MPNRTKKSIKLLSQLSMQHSPQQGTKKKPMDWGGRRKESVLHLELIDIPDGRIGRADIAVGFGERAVQVLLETGRLLPH